MKQVPHRVRSNVIRLVVFSLVVAGIMVWLLLAPSRHDTSWQSALRSGKRGSVVAAQDIQRGPEVVSGNTTPRVFKDPFDLVNGVDYFSDYDISKVRLPEPGEDFDDGLHPTWQFRYMNVTTSKYPFKWLSAKPRVALIPNFLSDEECDAMISLASPRLERSQVVPFQNAKSKNTIDEVRTSSQTWLDISSGIGKQVADRILDLVHFPSGSSEMMQILRYQTDQKYDAHNDYFDPRLYGPQSTNRAVTAFLYLSTVEEGGHTWFPDADGKVHEQWNFKGCKRGLGYKPQKGNVVVFYDMKPNGEYDPLSLHGGCPVKRGVKWGGTLWLRVKTQ
jgi:prolyl 4-hydroxylase